MLLLYSTYIYMYLPIKQWNPLTAMQIYAMQSTHTELSQSLYYTFGGFSPIISSGCCRRHWGWVGWTILVRSYRSEFDLAENLILSNGCCLRTQPDYTTPIALIISIFNTAVICLFTPALLGWWALCLSDSRTLCSLYLSTSQFLDT